MKSVSIVLLPGLDGTGRLFEPLLRHLPQWINPVVVSYPKDQPYGYQDLIKIVNQRLPEDDDFIILGESFSGPLSIMIASQRPKRLKGLILCATFAKNPFRFLPPWAGYFSVSPIYLLWPVTIKLRAILARGKYEKLVQMALEAIKSVKSEVISARVKAIFKVNVEHDLMKINVPILYMRGRKDYLIKKHNIEAIKRLREDTEVIDIDTQHFLLQLEPEKAADEITKFIKTLS
jgi:pimeloyl-ACP methyl ester carboxylesterase